MATRRVQKLHYAFIPYNGMSLRRSWTSKDPLEHQFSSIRMSAMMAQLSATGPPNTLIWDDYLPAVQLE